MGTVRVPSGRCTGIDPLFCALSHEESLVAEPLPHTVMDDRRATERGNVEIEWTTGDGIDAGRGRHHRQRTFRDDRCSVSIVAQLRATRANACVADVICPTRWALLPISGEGGCRIDRVVAQHPPPTAHSDHRLRSQGAADRHQEAVAPSLAEIREPGAPS